MNEYDSAKMLDLLKGEEDYELAESEQQADLLILNTCSIREKAQEKVFHQIGSCLLYTSPSPRDAESSRMPSSA